MNRSSVVQSYHFAVKQVFQLLDLFHDSRREERQGPTIRLPPAVRKLPHRRGIELNFVGCLSKYGSCLNQPHVAQNSPQGVTRGTSTILEEKIGGFGGFGLT